jgi:hypothetical protein
LPGNSFRENVNQRTRRAIHERLGRDSSDGLHFMQFPFKAPKEKLSIIVMESC